MARNEPFLSGLAARLALLVGGVVLASIVAVSSIDAGNSGGRAAMLLGALLASAVAGWTVYTAIQSHVLRPLQRLTAAAKVQGGDPFAALEQALHNSQCHSGRLADLEAQTSSLRHDIRGVLSPVLLTADRLSEHADPKVAKAAEVVIRAVNRATERLAATRLQAAQPGASPDQSNRNRAG